MRKVALFALTLCLSGCRLPEDEWGVVRVIWNDFPWWSVVWRLGFWTLLGAFVGLLIGIFLSLLFHRWGAYRLPWPRVRFWLTAVIITLNIIAMPLFFGTIGSLEGLFRSTEVAVRRSVIGKEWLPQIAGVGADAVCFSDAFVENDQCDWEVIQKERKPVNIVRLMNKLDKVQGGVGEKMTEKAKEQLFADNPDWKGGVGETVIDWTLPYVITYLLNRKLQGKLADYGVPDVWVEMKKEACKDGDDLMSHAEITAYLNERVMIPLLLFPLKNWVTGTQWSTLGIVAAWFATPPVLMFITRWIVFWWRRRQNRMMCGDKL